MRRDRFQFGFYRIADLQRVDKLLDGLLGNACIRPRKRFQCFVWLRITFAAQDGLEPSSHYRPALIQVGTHSRFVQPTFASAFQEALEGDFDVCHRDADVSNHGRIRQVALQTGDRQFTRQVFQERIGDA